MEKTLEPDVLREICRKIRVENQVTHDHRTRLFGSRFERAWEALREGRIKKYAFKPSGRIVWIVVGKQRDYLVMPDAEFCSCNDFYFKFDEGHLCYHIIAQKLAEAMDQFDLIEDDDRFYDVLIKEWKAVDIRVSKKASREDSVK